MNHKRLKLIVILLLVLGLTGLQAQESVNSTGGITLGSGGSVSYSVGQVSFQTHKGTNGSVAEGVQQPYEISVVTTVEEATVINLSVSVYPNPTTDFLILKVENIELSALSYELYNTQGKLLQNQKIESNRISIPMSNLVPATYLVKVKQENKEIKIFKIIKN